MKVVWVKDKDYGEIPCIALPNGIIEFPSRYAIIIDFTSLQQQKERDFINEMLDELEKFFKGEL